jgi:hypothetical protein
MSYVSIVANNKQSNIPEKILLPKGKSFFHMTHILVIARTIDYYGKRKGSKYTNTF